MPRPITPEDLWRLRRVGQPEPAPDGSFVVVPVTTFDVDANRGTTRLYLVRPGEDPIPLTSGGVDSTRPAVSPDGRRVAFVRKADPDADTQLYVMRVDGGEAERLTELPLGVRAPRWMPDGSGILFLGGVYRDALGPDEAAERKQELEANTVKAHATEHRFYRFWDRWLTDGRVDHVFHIDPATRELRDLTPDLDRLMDYEDPSAQYDVSPDGTEVAFAAEMWPPDDPHFRQRAVYTVPIAGGTPAQLVDAVPPGGQQRPRYSPDGHYLVYGIQREHDFYADRVRLVRYDRSTGEEAVLTEDWDRSASGWEVASDTIVFSAQDDGRTHLYSLPVTGGTPQLLTRGGYAHGPRPTAAGTYFRTENLSAPPEIAVVDAAGEKVDVITSFNAGLLGDIDMGRVDDVRFAGADGTEIQMFVVYPPGYDGSSRYPLVHDIHGGPHSISGDQWHWRWNAQAFAAPGYVVALVNFHGSTSWGQEFAAGIHGAWGDKPGRDVLAATDHLIDHGIADPDRMVIAGGSYGGYLVSWLMSQTDRFTAAVCHAGVTNLVGQYASDVTEGRPRAMGANVWEDADRILQWSPTHHASGMNTPTLVIHGEKDYRVVVTQGLELYGILKAKGVEARLVYYPDEGHWILKPQNSLHWYREVLAWFERYLG